MVNLKPNLRQISFTANYFQNMKKMSFAAHHSKKYYGKMKMKDEHICSFHSFVVRIDVRIKSDGFEKFFGISIFSSGFVITSEKLICR